jgi:hypothetical protein
MSFFPVDRSEVNNNDDSPMCASADFSEAHIMVDMFFLPLDAREFKMLTANFLFRFWNLFKRTDRGVYVRFPSKLFTNRIKIALIAVYVRLLAPS